MARVRVLFFGQLKDVAGQSEDALDLAPSQTLGDAFEHYATRFPALRGFSKSILLSRNHQFAGREEVLQDGDEIAFLPPVSGGTARQPYTHEIADAASGNFFALTSNEIDAQAVVERILRDQDGAVVDFQGVVRNNTKGRSTRFLDYECYEPMAIKEMARIGSEIAAAHPIGRIGIVHRLGRLLIGEASVVIVVTSPHRRVAFEAALAAIDRLKKTVPIWKKEHFTDGEIWVEGDWDEQLQARSSATGRSA